MLNIIDQFYEECANEAVAKLEQDGMHAEYLVDCQQYD